MVIIKCVECDKVYENEFSKDVDFQWEREALWEGWYRTWENTWRCPECQKE